jgi:Domain of unknown function (DUF4157)
VAAGCGEVSRLDSALERARLDGGHAATAAQVSNLPAAARVNRARATPGLLRPSQVPVQAGATARSPAGAASGRPRPAPGARPSTVPARPAPDLPSGPGQPLDGAVLQEMQDRLGADFSQVRVHADGAAHSSAAGFGARAYTLGNHVVIGAGGAGKHVLAHELTHVIQQRQGPVAGTDHGAGVRVSDPSDPFERAAESAAARAMSPAGPRPAHGQPAGHQPGAVTSSPRALPPGPAPGVAVQRFRNPQVPQERHEIWNDPAARNINQLPADQRAQALLRSSHPVYWYGREPRTDEQIEVLASTKYLHHRRHEWQQELRARNLGAARRMPAWEHFQSAVASYTRGEPNRQPWFLDPGHGYQVNAANQVHLHAAQQEAAHPVADDPQQLVGSTYARDTGLARQGQAFAPNHRRVIRSSAGFGSTAGTAGQVIRVFDNSNPLQATGELRLRIQHGYADGTSFTVTGQVIATPHFPNFNLPAGNQVLVEGLFGDSLRITRLPHGPSRTSPRGGWSAELNSTVFYQAVVLPEDALGLRRQNTTTERNRGAVPRALDDALMTDIVNRYTANTPISYANALGPARNPLNIQDLGWNIVAASYRRLGGDSIFTEADHPNRDRRQYSNRIQPPGAVDVTNSSWYYASQEHNADRFVGGRSNSTLNYLQTASMLYQLNDLTLEECLDVAAFVIADMVVSGEHSMPECMTTVAMVAPASPPWSQHRANLTIAQPTETLALWLRLVDQDTRRAIYDETVQALTTYLERFSNTDQWDATLLKVLVALGKQLFNYRL